MKSVVISEAAYAALTRISTDWRRPASDVLESLLGVGPTPATDGLLFHLFSADFTGRPNPEARYLELLAWVAAHHRADFVAFLTSLDHVRPSLLLTQDEVTATRARHLTRQVSGTHYWAVLGLDDNVRARFVRRLLEHIGCHDETIALALRLLTLEPSAPGFRLLKV